MQFDPARTAPGPFTLATGATTSVPRMTHGRAVTIGYLRDGDVTVLDLPYSGGAFTMTIALPRDPAGVDSPVRGWENGVEGKRVDIGGRRILKKKKKSDIRNGAG